MEIGNINKSILPSKVQTKKAEDKPTNNALTQENKTINSKAVNCENISSYFPNINFNTSNAFKQQIDNAAKLSDGSIILRPQLLGGSSQIVPNEDGTYTINTQGSCEGAEIETKIKTEEEVIADKGLCAGLAKPIGNGNYEVTYEVRNDETGEKTPITINLDTKGLENLLNMEHMHINNFL